MAERWVGEWRVDGWRHRGAEERVGVAREVWWLVMGAVEWRAEMWVERVLYLRPDLL